jgi:hypothetical protein
VTTELATVEATAIDKMAPEQFFISNAIADRGLFAEADRRLRIILQTGLIPDSIKTTAQAMTAIEFGHDLGMSVLESLRSIQVVKGNPVLKAATVGALIKKRFGTDAFSVAQCDEEACRIDVRQIDQDGQTVQLRVEFTQDDAKKAGLWGKNQWAKYPVDMLYARAISRVQKRCFQHLGSGEVWIAELVQKDSRPAPRSLGDI